jgi:hypothetical protein
MLIPRVKLVQATFGPCKFETDQTLKIDQELCKVRSGDKKRNTLCANCQSPFRFCRECAKVGRWRLVVHAEQGKGLCASCEALANPAKKKSPAPTSAAQAAPVQERSFRLNPEVVALALSPKSELTQDTSSRQHTPAPQKEKPQVEVVPAGTVATSQEAEMHAEVSVAQAPKWPNIVARYKNSSTDASVHCPGIFELSDAVAEMKAADMSGRAIKEQFGTDLQWVSYVFGIRRLLPPLREYLDDSCPIQKRLTLQQAYMVSLRNGEKLQSRYVARILAHRSERFLHTYAPLASLDQWNDVTRRHRLGRNIDAQESASTREIVVALAQMSNAQVTQNSMASAFGEKVVWVRKLLILKKLSDAVWALMPTTHTPRDTGLWTIRRLIRIAAQPDRSQVAFSRDLFANDRANALHAVRSQIRRTAERLKVLSSALNYTLSVGTCWEECSDECEDVRKELHDLYSTLTEMLISIAPKDM